jgi:uncharacterized protein YvpB
MLLISDMDSYEICYIKNFWSNRENEKKILLKFFSKDTQRAHVVSECLFFRCSFLVGI